MMLRQVQVITSQSLRMINVQFLYQYSEALLHYLHLSLMWVFGFNFNGSEITSMTFYEAIWEISPEFI